MNIQYDEDQETIVNIRVVGVGGGGGNAVEHMIGSGIKNVEYVCVNTDLNILRQSKADQVVQIGAKLTKGRGAGNKPEVGRQSADESHDEIAAALKGANMVFITAGMGGGTGTGAAPVVAEIARELGILTVGVVTKPFKFEREQKMKQAEAGIKELSKNVDSLVVIPNERLLVGLEKPLTMRESFSRSDEVLYKSVKSISDLVLSLGFVNLDFADVTEVMKDAGIAHMAVGEGVGKNKAEDAANAVISSPILETTLVGAGKILANLTISNDVLAEEIDMFSKLITEAAKPDAEVIIGYVFDDKLEDQMNVTVVGTGFDEQLSIVLEDSGEEPVKKVDEIQGETAAAANDGSFNDIMRLFSEKD